MAKISTKSPYFINSTVTNLDAVTLKLWIYTGTQTTDRPALATYTLISTAINNNVMFEIGELIGDFINTGFDGTYDAELVWVDYTTTQTILGVIGTESAYVQHYATKGYTYFEEGANYDSGNGSLITRGTVQRLSGQTYHVPYDNNQCVAYQKWINGSLNTFGNLNISLAESSDQIIYMEVASDVEKLIFTLADTSVNTIYFEDVEECKYTPHKITFLNKEGVLESMWMFKRSAVQTTMKSETYMNNQININTNYNVNQHQMNRINVTSNEQLSMNTGFIPESSNEMMRQLLSSDEVYIDYNSQTLPINIKTEELLYKTRLDDKLINYGVKVDFAFNKINTVR